MPTYINQKPDDPIRTVAFEQAGAKHYGFVTVADAGAAESVKAVMERYKKQHFISQSSGRDGVLLVYELMDKDALLNALAKDGQHFVPPAEEKKKFNPWAWRGILSIVGQSGQLLSGWFVRKNAKAIYEQATSVFEQSAKSISDNEQFESAKKSWKKAQGNSAALVGFASLNLIANIINVVFGAQKKNDLHQLEYLKQQFNDQFQTQYGADVKLDAPDAKLVAGKEKAGSFLQQYSVSFGEIFLRTLGSVSLAFPITQVKEAYQAFRADGFKAGFAKARTEDPVTFIYGLAMLMGKFTSFAATEPDPYNPEPPSAMRTFREKVAFKLSSVIEGAGAVYATKDRATNSKHRIALGNDTIQDIPGAVGNAVFVAGYGIRYTAPYGVREVYLPELYAHAAKAIAHLPKEQQAEATVSTAQWMADHFSKEKKDSYRLPTIYATLAKTVSEQSAAKVVNPAQLEAKCDSAAPSTTIGHVQDRSVLQQTKRQHSISIA